MLTTETTPNAQTTETTSMGLTTEIALDVQANETSDITDSALITKAKGLNRSIDKYVRKGIEAFWMMGEALGTLYKRRHLQADGKWVSILREIGVSGTTDRNARRFFETCEFADLHLYKNKSDALRKLGIIASPQPIMAAPPKDANPVKESPSAPAVPTFGETDREDAGSEADDRFTESKGTVTVGAGVTADNAGAPAGGRIEAKDGEGLRNVKNPKPSSQAPADPQETIARIVGLLENLSGDEIEYTPEFAAQVEMASKALDLLRRKGVARAAA